MVCLFFQWYNKIEMSGFYSQMITGNDDYVYIHNTMWILWWLFYLRLLPMRQAKGGSCVHRNDFLDQRLPVMLRQEALAWHWCGSVQWRPWWRHWNVHKPEVNNDGQCDAQTWWNCNKKIAIPCSVFQPRRWRISRLLNGIFQHYLMKVDRLFDKRYFRDHTSTAEQKNMVSFLLLLFCILPSICYVFDRFNPLVYIDKTKSCKNSTPCKSAINKSWCGIIEVIAVTPVEQSCY